MKYEYTIVSSFKNEDSTSTQIAQIAWGAGIKKGLNELGDEGWDLCGTIILEGNTTSLIFKRIKK